MKFIRIFPSNNFVFCNYSTYFVLIIDTGVIQIRISVMEDSLHVDDEFQENKLGDKRYV